MDEIRAMGGYASYSTMEGTVNLDDHQGNRLASFEIATTNPCTQVILHGEQFIDEDLDLVVKLDDVECLGL